MNKIIQRLTALREIMMHSQLDLYVIPTSDDHQSEYISGYYAVREFMSGFTGSAGTLVVTLKEAALFTDGRYFLQAEKQLEGSSIQLMKSGMEGIPSVLEYIQKKLWEPENLCFGGAVGFDGSVVAARWGMLLEKWLQAAGNAQGIHTACLVNEIWTDRPRLPQEKAFYLEECYSGEAVASKLARLREAMKERQADVHVLATLDDIAWLFNIRGNDIECNPVVLAFAAITQEQAILFADAKKFDLAMQEMFCREGIALRPYEDIYEYVLRCPGKRLLLDSQRINYELYQCAVSSPAMQILDQANPTLLMKAVKNATEVANLKKVHQKDGVAFTRFLFWLKQTMQEVSEGSAKPVTEYEAMNYLDSLRAQQEGFLELSFPTICAYGTNAAMIHYGTREEGSATILPEGMLLVDSGGQYYEGTTDMTRTIAVGPVTEEMKKCYTLTLKGMLQLSAAKFQHGCTGVNLDILAREPLWGAGLDYRHGTGHGIGYLLNVHEAPNAFRWKYKPDGSDNCVLEEGMVTSNEPGVYLDGKFGIRIENQTVCRKDIANEYGQFMALDTLTLAPLEVELIDPQYLSPVDIQQIHTYHQRVYEALAPELQPAEKKWLRGIAEAV